MSKKGKTPKQDRRTEPRLPSHDFSGGEAPASPAHEASMAVESMRNDPSDPRPRDPSTTRTDSGDMDARGSEGNANRRHPSNGQFVPGPTMAGMTHDVTVFDLNDDAQNVAMRRSTAPSMPNAMPAGPDVKPAVNVLDMSTLQELTE